MPRRDISGVDADLRAAICRVSVRWLEGIVAESSISAFKHTKARSMRCTFR